MITGGAGSGKSTLAAERIKAAAEAGKSVLACIPEQFSFEYDRTMYGKLGAALYNSIETAGFLRIANDIFIKYGGSSGKSADDLTKTVLMHRTIMRLSAEKAFVCFGRQAGTKTFAESCLKTVKEFMTAGISPDMILGLSGKIGDFPKLSDIALIYSEYTSALAECGLKDGDSDIFRAAEAAVKNKCFAGRHIFIDEFKSFTGDQYKMIAAMLMSAESVTVAVSAEEKPAQRFGLFDTANETYLRIMSMAEDMGVPAETVHLDGTKRFRYPETAFLSENIMRPRSAKFSGKCEKVRLICGDNVYDEADFTAAEIRRLTAIGECRYGDIAVVSRNMESCRAALEGAFERFGIEMSGSGTKSAENSPEAIYCCSALRLAAKKIPSAEDVLRLLKTGLAGFSREEVSEFENYIYTVGIDGKMLTEPFVYKDDMTELSPEELEGFVPEMIRAAVITPIERFRSRAEGKTADEVCLHFSAYLKETGLAENVALVINELSNPDEKGILPSADKLARAREHKQTLEMLVKYITAVRRSAGDTVFPLPEFYELFSAGTSKLRTASPPRTLDCVTVEPAETARLASPKVIFILGVNEGVFPMTPKAGGLFSADEREQLVGAGLGLSGGLKEKAAEEKFIAYTMLSAASERVYMSCAMAGPEGGALYPSRLMGQAEKMLGISPENVSEMPLSFFSSTKKAAFYTYARAFDRRDTESVSIKRFLEDDPETSPTVKALERAARHDPHRLSSTELADKFFGGRIFMSPTSFETFSKCPFAYFCKFCMMINERKKITLEYSAGGSAVHYCLSELMSEHRSDFETMPLDEIDAELRRYLAEFRDKKLFGVYGKTMRFNANYDRIFDTARGITVHLQQEKQQSKFRPAAFELRMKYTKAFEKNGFGGRISFSGIVDRADTYDNGSRKYLRIIDYKTGNKKFTFDDSLNGLNMQMLFYLFFLTDPLQGMFPEYVPAGALYQPAGAVKPGLDRESGSADRQKLKNSFYRMKGFVIEDDDVIAAMEEPENGVVSGTYIPIKANRSGGYSKSCMKYLADADKMHELHEETERTLVNAAEELYEGNVEAFPQEDINGGVYCQYCAFKAVCGNFPPKETKPYRH